MLIKESQILVRLFGKKEVHVYVMFVNVCHVVKFDSQRNFDSGPFTRLYSWPGCSKREFVQLS